MEVWRLQADALPANGIKVGITLKKAITLVEFLFLSFTRLST